MRVAEAVGSTLASLGVRTAFGVVGSGNFRATAAMTERGVRFVAARHEAGAATMADAYARMSGSVGVVSVHQGCGLTNAVTGLVEAAKSRTPLLVVAGEATNQRSNFWIDQVRLAHSVGVLSERVTSAAAAVSQASHAYRRAAAERRTVLLNLPLDVQDETVDESQLTLPDTSTDFTGEPVPDPAEASADLLAALNDAQRPVFVAGRGSRSAAARRALMRLAEASGALLATSAAARGLFHDSPFSLDVSGGFSTPLAAELISHADLVVGWGCSLNMWTTRHGELVGDGATVAQVDVEAGAIGRHRPVDIGVVGDVAGVANVLDEQLRRAGSTRSAYRTPAISQRLAQQRRWRDTPYEDLSDTTTIDPRTLTMLLDDILPAERVLAVDSGNFMGYPSMFLSVPDENGMCFTQAFQSIGLGLATAVGAALARPDRLPVAALGDGGALMSIAELETVVRLALPMVIVVYNDSAYGAEVHHFRGSGHSPDTVTFPETDIAAIGREFGCEGITIRNRREIEDVRRWVDGPRRCPLLIDAKVTRSRPSWWLEHAFAGH